MRGGDNFDLKHRQTLREALRSGAEASLVTVSDAEKDSMGINNSSAATRRLYAIIPIEQGSRLADITVQEVGSLASQHNAVILLTTEQMLFGREATPMDLPDDAPQWSKDFRRMVSL